MLRLLSLLPFIIVLGYCQPAIADDSLKLSIDTSGIIDLLDLQDKSLDELETAWNMMQAQITALNNYNKELQIHIEDSEKLILTLQTSLETARKENAAALEYQKSLEKQLANANHRYKAASIAGPLSGVVFATGGSLLICGAVQKNDPMLYTGLGLAGSSLVIWILGKAVFQWW